MIDVTYFDRCYFFLLSSGPITFPLGSNCDVGWHGEDLKSWMGAGDLDSPRVSKSQLRVLRKPFYHVHCLLGESWVTFWAAIFLHSRGCCFLAHVISDALISEQAEKLPFHLA